MTSVHPFPIEASVPELLTWAEARRQSVLEQSPKFRARKSSSKRRSSKLNPRSLHGSATGARGPKSPDTRRSSVKRNVGFEVHPRKKSAGCLIEDRVIRRKKFTINSSEIQQARDPSSERYES